MKANRTISLVDSRRYMKPRPDNLNYATVVTYGGAMCGVQEGAHGRVSSARQVWEADATRKSDSKPA